MRVGGGRVQDTPGFFHDEKIQRELMLHFCLHNRESTHDTLLNLSSRLRTSTLLIRTDIDG